MHKVLINAGSRRRIYYMKYYPAFQEGVSVTQTRDHTVAPRSLSNWVTYTPEENYFLIKPILQNEPFCFVELGFCFV